MLLTANDWWDYFARIAVRSKPLSIDLTSYNLYSALRNWKRPSWCSSNLPRYCDMNPAQKLLFMMNVTAEESRIYFTSAKDKVGRSSAEVSFLKKYLPRIGCYVHPANHSKVVLMRFLDGSFRLWSGSCNLTSSKSTPFYDTMCEVVNLFDKKNHLQLLRRIKEESREV
jgi:hypothetical protein